MKYKSYLLFLLLTIFGLIILILIVGGGLGRNLSPSLFEKNKITFIAHRGLYNYYAENSLEGYQQCEKMKFDAIETDIRVTRDRQLVVFHDDSTGRLLGFRSMLEELNKADLEKHFLFFQGRPTQNKVLSLDELLNHFQNKFIIYLDNKVNKKWVADSLVIHLEKKPAGQKIIVASSNLLFLSYLKFRNKNVYTALEGFDAGKEWIYYLIPRRFKPDYYSSFMSKVDEGQINFLHKNNLIENKIVYGVDSANVHTVIESGIQNMIIDFDSSFADIFQKQSVSQKDSILHAVINPSE